MMSPDKPAAMVDEQLREACAALDQRLRAGESVRTEDLLTECPDLASHAECVLELAYTEFVARDALGETCDVDAWYARFPDHADDLRELFEVHRFVQQAAEETVVPRGDMTEDDDALPAQPLLFHEDVDAERRLGNYELIEEIGRGGMGVVYKARQIGVRRVVALKLILAGAHAGRERYERFEAEAETVGRLAHPNIVQIHEVGTEQGRPFLSLEFVEGGSLDRKLAGAPLSAREAATLLNTLAAAMRHAHERGVIHRDLKPANILLTLDGVPKITDFGLAKRIFEEQSGQTASGAMLGTPSYMAPEQALGNSRDSGVAADVYALGAILYELLTGRPPFRGATLLDTLEQVRSQEPVAPRQLVGKLPRDLETICLKCLQKLPAHRYASAAELADDLQRFLDHLPIRARPVGYVGRLARWSTRNPLLAALTATLAVVITAVLIVAPIVAVTQTALRGEVQKQLNEVVRQGRAKSASLLATRSRLATDDAPQRSILLAMEAMEAHRAAGERPPSTIEQALRDALSHTGGLALAGHQGQLTSALFTPDSRWLVTGGADGTTRLWPVAAGNPADGSVILKGHRAPVSGIAVSHGGRWLVTASGDHSLRLWNLSAADVSLSSYEIAGHRERLTAIAFSPDDRWLFTADHAGNGKLHRMSGDEPPSLTQELQLELPILDGRFSLDGRWLAVGGVDKHAHVWAVSDSGLGDEHVLRGHKGFVVALAFDPRRARLATASVDHTVRLWNLDAETPEESPVVLTGHTSYVSSVAFTPDGRWLVSGSYDGTARRWDLDAPDPQANAEVFSGHTGRINAIAVSRDGRWLATCSRDKSVRLWDFAADQPGVNGRALHGHDDAVHAVAFSDDGHWLASASADGTARLWDLAAGVPAAAASQTYAHDGKRIQQVAISSTGRWLASCAGDGNVRIWDRQTHQEHARLPHESAVRFAAFSPDERWLVTAEMDKSPKPPKLWDLHAPDPAAAPIDLPGHTQSIECLLMDPAGNWVATGSRFDDGTHEPDGTVRIWSLGEGELGIGRVIARHHADVGQLVNIPGHDLVASGSVDGAIQLSIPHATESSTHNAPMSIRAADVDGLAALPDGRGIATSDTAGNVRWLDLNESAPKPLTLYQGKLPLHSLNVSADGRWLAAVDVLDQVLLWDIKAFQAAAGDPSEPIVLAGDEKTGRGVVGCVFSPDSRRLATYATDGAMRVWEFDQQGPNSSPLAFLGHAQQIQSAVFTPDSRTLISGSYDGTVREWPLEQADLLAHARRVAGRALTKEERRRFVEE